RCRQGRSSGACWGLAGAVDELRPSRRSNRLLAASNGRDDLVLLDVRIERRGVDHVLAVDFLGDGAAALASVAQDALGFLDGFGVIDFPFDDLVPSAVGDDYSAHMLTPSLELNC